LDHTRLLSYSFSSGTLFAITVSHQQRVFLTCGSIATYLPMLFITQYKITCLSAINSNRLAALPAKMTAFNSHIRWSAYSY